MHYDLDFFAALRRMKHRAPPIPPQIEAPRADRPALPSSAPRAIGPAGLTLIKRFEGCARQRRDGRFAAYPDPGTGGAPWTIGWGATGKGIGRSTVWSQEQCDARLEADLVRFAGEVARALGDVPTSQAQFDALVSFHYNTGAIARATLTRLHKAGEFDAAAAEFGRWVHAGGKRLAGLVRRRAAEAALYRNG
jgi:GH24 family phage-related lysozyme (muramidase)